MKRIFISVEGQTEETFVRDVLVPHLAGFGIFPIPIVLATKIIKQGNKFKGGISSYEQVRKDITRLVQDTNILAITTMYDFYKLPSDFPGYSNNQQQNCYDRANFLENEFKKEIGIDNFHPYFQIHEFEAFLFVSPIITAKYLLNLRRTKDIEDIKKQYKSPEEINNGEETAPSKRIIKCFPNYQKPLDGVIISIEVGLNNIRNECPHFNNWLLWLESL